MHKIIKTIDPEKDLTVFTGTGAVTAADFVTAIEGFYDSTVTSNVLWDLTACDLDAISAQDVKLIVGLSSKYSEKRPSGKTAVVGSEALTYGLLRMYEMTKQLEGLPFDTRSFRDVETARKWLLSD